MIIDQLTFALSCRPLGRLGLLFLYECCNLNNKLSMDGANNKLKISLKNLSSNWFRNHALLNRSSSLDSLF